MRKAASFHVFYIMDNKFFFSLKVIVLNGETGAGKTFNANKALAFLTASTKNASSAGVQKRGAVCDIVQTISDACRLISAFTTAPTAKNEVSSRHVQLVWLEYKKGSICGAKISSYLLERDRVTRGYCNFQIFSQVILISCIVLILYSLIYIKQGPII